jgi:FKBP-type peptidyl-prolyl cis-trans isomerase
MKAGSILAAFAVLAVAAAVVADDKKDLKLPPLDAKEWRELKDKGGLKVWDVKEGKGAEAKAGGQVKVHYTGWLTGGKVFDSSVQRDEPIEFGLDEVINGWQEGIPGMKVGGVRRLYIPSAMAYGKKGRGSVIPPDSDLVFEVELLDLPK